jgi:hypothetical protein
MSRKVKTMSEEMTKAKLSSEHAESLLREMTVHYKSACVDVYDSAYFASKVSRISACGTKVWIEERRFSGSS